MVEFSYKFYDFCCRTPLGVRGLKYFWAERLKLVWESHPAWGAWIEIHDSLLHSLLQLPSHPAWGAWIEIGIWRSSVCRGQVAPRLGCVDWNKSVESFHQFAEGRTPLGVRGLKSSSGFSAIMSLSRTPLGVRGLKYPWQ